MYKKQQAANMRSTIRNLLATSVRALAVCMLNTSAYAQADHTIQAQFISQPSGPNSEFSVGLKLVPSDVDIVGFQIAVGYHNDHIVLESVTDNTGQPQAAIDYIVRAEEPLTGVSYANAFRAILASTQATMIEPENLGQLNFRTTASYNDPQNRAHIYLTGFADPNGPDDNSGGLVNAMFQYIPTDYDSIEPESSVDDWMVY